MSEKSIESGGKGFLALLLPISFLIIFLVSTWRVLLGVILLTAGFNLWQRYKWQKWCQEVNPIFNKMIRESQGRITPMDLAMKGNFSGQTAKRYLDTKATEFGASILNEDSSPVYHFITGSILGSILDSSEPIKELASKPVAINAQLLAAPLPEVQKEKAEAESLTQATTEEVKKPLEKQLVFGSLIQSELAKRLNVYSSTVYKRRNDPDFSEWSRSRDPDGIAWSFSRTNKEFFPLEEEGSRE
ncbi:hypothetical protein [Tolypothrix sp. VBCCA 56010]|uniref:hypothetical protein n=1 Tax=Tolypothrix sp. VBCCA 56010 TaxID=3137731 RepID=UPI003D7DA453